MLHGKPLCIDLFCGLGGWSEGFIAEGYRVVGFDITRHVYALPDELPELDGVKNAGYQAESYKGKAWNDESAKALGLMGKDKRPLTRIARYPAQLVLQDVLTIHGSQFRNADIIVASPPCQQYSWLAMPWSRSKDPNNSKAAKALRAKWESEGPDNRLFDACFRIQREASYAKRLELKCCDLDYQKPDCPRCHIPLIVENVRGAQEWVGISGPCTDIPAEERWRRGRSAWNYGSFHLWSDVPALMPIGTHRKVKGVQSWSDFGTPGYKATAFNDQAVREMRAIDEGQKTVAHVNKRDGHGHTRHLTNQAEHDGVKIGGDWFSDPNSTCRKHGSKSSARKAASAMIAKIPLHLSTHIARVYWPERLKGASS